MQISTTSSAKSFTFIKAAEALFCTPKDVSVLLDQSCDPEKMLAEKDYGLFFDHPEDEFHKWNRDYHTSEKELTYKRQVLRDGGNYHRQPNFGAPCFRTYWRKVSLSLIATFAHELTHIWQYTHWDNKKDFKKCSKSKRLLIYEGMAKWAEIQYLYLIGETNVAKREEYVTRNRRDEYGLGFCLYEEHYPLSREAMSCEDTPFTPDRYPFD